MKLFIREFHPNNNPLKWVLFYFHFPTEEAIQSEVLGVIKTSTFAEVDSLRGQRSETLESGV